MNWYLFTSPKNAEVLEENTFINETVQTTLKTPTFC